MPKPPRRAPWPWTGAEGGSVTEAAAIPLALAMSSGICDSPLSEGACDSRARNRRWPHIEEQAAKDQTDGGKATLKDWNQDGNGWGWELICGG